MTKNNLNLSPAQEFIYISKYARWIPELSRRENSWEESTKRYFDFFEKRFGSKVPEKYWTLMKDKVNSMGVMPSMRALYCAGEALEQNNASAFNCTYLPFCDIFSPCELFFLLLSGCGVGFSTEARYINKIPPVPKQTSAGAGVHCVSDSREGWAESLKVQLEAFWKGEDIEFDYSQIRPRGARLKTSGGRAPGKGPLIELHKFVKDTVLSAQGRKLTSLEWLDLGNQIGDSVVSGGQRRAAEINFSDLEDDLIRDAKTGSFHPRRFNSNNSAVYYSKPDAITFMKEWSSLAKSGTGERGILNLGAIENQIPKRRKFTEEFRSNPCARGDTLIHTKQGHFQIKDLVGKTVDVWDGMSWRTVDSFGITSHNEKVISFILKQGHEICVTPYHEMEMEDGRRIEAKDVVIGDLLKKSNAPSSLSFSLPVGFNEVVEIKDAGVEENVYCLITKDPDKMALSCGIIIGRCGEIILRPHEMCNLSEVIVRKEDTFDDLINKVKAAVWIGAMQSTLTDFKFIRNEFKKNCEEERLLGVSLSGQMDNPELMTDEKLDILKKYAIKECKKACDTLSISMSAAITTTKPSGTVSQLCDSSSGIHARYAPYYIRRYRISSTDPLYRLMRDQGVKFVPENGQENLDEKDVITWVCSFPIKAPDGAITANNLSAIEQLEWYLKIRKHWAEHNVSCTVYLGNDDWMSVGAWVYDHFDEIVGISFLPYNGGIYKNAPYEAISKEEYEKLINEFPIIDYSDLSKYELEDTTTSGRELACQGGYCELV